LFNPKPTGAWVKSSRGAGPHGKLGGRPPQYGNGEGHPEKKKKPRGGGDQGPPGGGCFLFGQAGEEGEEKNKAGGSVQEGGKKVAGA